MRPRPVILFVFAYGAGLSTGLLRFGDPAGVSLALLALGFWGRSHLLGLLAAAALVGRLSGDLARERERTECAATLPAGRVELVGVLEEPADSAGGGTVVLPRRAGCGGTVEARWPARHPLPAGATVTLAAQWIPRPPGIGRADGILVVDSIRAVTPGGGAAARLRTWLTEGIHALYGARAPIVEALVLNRRATMDATLRDQYAQSGLVHLLSISGFHVGLLAGWVFLIARALLSRERALLLAALVSVSYVAFLGWPPPATRAAALTLLAAASQVRQRRVEPDALLAVTCLLVLLVDPWALLDLGAWLSAAALWGATTFARWSDRRLGSGFGWRTLAASVGATLATAPLTASVLGTVSLIGIALNFVAIPLAAWAVPGVLASLLLLPIGHAAAAAMAAGAGMALAGLDGLARLGAAVPGGHLLVPAEWSSAVPWVAVLAIALWGLRRTTVSVALLRWSLGGAAMIWIVTALWWAPLSADAGSTLTLHFLSVGQGDGAVLRTPGGHWVVIDAGPRSDHDDAGRRIVVPFLRRQGARRVSAVVVSHAHADHLGGVRAVLDQFPVDLVLEPGELVPDPLYLSFLDEVAAVSAPWKAGRPGDRFELDSVTFTLLHPDPAWPEWGDDLNEDSIVLLVRYRDFEALFPGDAGWHAESLMAGQVGGVDLLKVGHHGSRTATGDAWLDELHPRAAVISVGASNRYGHPAPETLARLAAHEVSVWRTDREGDVIVTSDGRTMTVRGRRGSESYSTH